ncbi:MAG: hypothetical protein BGO14_09310 [Chlamydiales bacterium 38-26]|nr:hypothetical protein [Chlamydiales bacterium]OJV11175.1 MAG: hypothetical protein BGO14_09310 [Chlamydiales bacterium 38-26]
MALLIMILSGVFGALSNLCMRISLEGQGSTRLFFVLQLFCTFLFLVGIYPVRTGVYELTSFTLLIGVGCGAALAIVKCLIGMAIKKGPSSLTFAVVNSASVLPALLLVVFLGNAVAIQYKPLHFIGTLLVVAGLFWAGWEKSGFKKKRTWIFLALMAFVFQCFYLCLTQWYTLVMNDQSLLTHFWFADSKDIKSQWFVPLVFASAWLIHLFIYWSNERRAPTWRESFWGFWGGMFNGICAFLFIKADEIATPTENPLLFPIFSVALIIACNLWGQYLYQEKVNWLANTVCLLGLTLGAGAL